MCQIVYKPANIVLTKTELNQGWSANSDGAGYMYAENDQLIVRKGFMSFAHFWRDIRNHLDKTLVIHFRIGTTGSISPMNTHPFVIHENLAMAHNGVLPSFRTVDLVTKHKYSDTHSFVEMILKQLPPDFLENAALHHLVDHYCVEENSKFVFMDNKGVVTIFNRKAGYDIDGIWKSSYGGVKGAVVKTYYSTGYCNRQGHFDYGYHYRDENYVWDPQTKTYKKPAEIDAKAKTDAASLAAKHSAKADDFDEFAAEQKDLDSKMQICDVCGGKFDPCKMQVVDGMFFCPSCVLEEFRAGLDIKTFEKIILTSAIMIGKALTAKHLARTEAGPCTHCKREFKAGQLFWHKNEQTKESENLCVICYPHHELTNADIPVPTGVSDGDATPVAFPLQAVEHQCTICEAYYSDDEIYIVNKKNYCKPCYFMLKAKDPNLFPDDAEITV